MYNYVYMQRVFDAAMMNIITIELNVLVIYARCAGTLIDAIAIKCATYFSTSVNSKHGGNPDVHTTLRRVDLHRRGLSASARPIYRRLPTVSIVKQLLTC
jgi:hypothetical protein